VGRAGFFILVVPLDRKLSTSLSELLQALEDERFKHVEYWCIYTIPRIKRQFHTDKAKLHNKVGSDPPPKLPGPIVQSYYKKSETGMACFVFFKRSQLDRDFATFLVWTPEFWQIELIKRVIEWTQKATHDMLGRPFGGEMPYAELQDFIWTPQDGSRLANGAGPL
jgi:hypothetical protein